jgi:outer membrane protein assembly factor BamB/predicted phosphodiesterase
MKKFLQTLYLLLILSAAVLAQEFKYAWITDTHIGSPGAKKNLESVINNINNKKDIVFVVITGDISEKGMDVELETAKTIFDSLKKPYYIIPGNHDTKWSESGCTKFKELWKDDKFAFNYNGVENIGMNSGIPWHGGGGHFAAEDLPWLDSVLTATPKNYQIIFYAHHPLDGDVDNWFEITNRLRNYNIKAILVGHGHEDKLLNFGGIPAAMGRSSLDDKDGWGYTLVKNKPDSLLFYEVTADSIRKFWGALGINKSKIPLIDSLQFINYTTSSKSQTKLKVNVLWKKNLETTLIASLLVNGSNIYAATKNGKILCYNLSGNLEWEYSSGETIFSKPVVYDSTFVFATIEGDLISLDASTGEVLQTIGLNEPLTSQLIKINVEYNGHHTVGVVAGTSKGNVYCYDIDSFEEIWENHSAHGMIETKPLYINNRIIYGSWDNYLYCIDSRTGIINWKWTENKNFYYSPAACRPVTDGHNVYITSPDKYVSAVDLMLGRTVWRKNNFNAWESIGISSDKKNLFVKCYKDNFDIVSAKKGKLIKEIKIGYGFDLSPITPLEWNGNIIFGSKEGKIYLIDKNNNYNALLFLGTARLLNIFYLKKNIFAASNMDGKIVVFEIN